MKFLVSALLVLVFVTVESAPGQESAPDHRALASTASGLEKTPAAQNPVPQDILRGFKSYYIKSDTIYLHRETLGKELQNRPEFAAWDLTATEDSKAADVVITITVPFLTWKWNYRMVYLPTGALLGTGKVSAAVEKTAAPQLAAMIVKRIGEARPLRGSFQNTQATPQAIADSRSEKGKSWRVRYISGPASGIGKDTPVTVTLNREWITVRKSKTLALSAPVRNVSAVDSRTEVHRAAKGWEDFWGASFDTLLRDDGNNSVAGAAAKGISAAFVLMGTVPIALAGEGILAPMKTTDHFVSLYWLEDGAVKSAEFRASGGDTKSLLAELKKVTGRRAEDIQELAKRRQQSIREQFDGAPIVGIDRQVSIGWHSLPPGSYRLIVVTRERNLAEIYFVPTDKTAKDLWNESPSEASQVSANTEDFATKAVAEFERRRTPLESKSAPSVFYREQNGIVTFSLIETDELILRFTPIPLGLAK
jgi:hypothetical protein